MPLTATNKKFLKETLKVELKKKPGWRPGTVKDDKVTAAKDKFKAFRAKEEEVISQIGQLKKVDANDPAVLTFEGEVRAAQAVPGTAVVGNALDAQAKIEQAIGMLTQTGNKVPEAIRKATDRNAYKAELTKAEELLLALTVLNKDGIEFDKPLKEKVTQAKGQANSGAHAGAVTTLKDAKAIHDRQAPKSTQYTKYLVELPKAEALQRNLMTLNRKTTDKYEQPVVDSIQSAKDSIEAVKLAPENDDIAEAVAALAGVKAQHAEQVKKAAAAQKGDLHSARHQPVYVDKVARIDEAIAELTPLPGTEAARLKLAGLKTKAEKFVQTGEYEKAYEALEGLSGALSEGRDDAGDFRQTAGGTKCKKPFQEATAALQAYSEIAGLGQSKFVDEKQKVLDAALREIEGKPAEARITTLAQELTTLANELKQETTKQAGLKRDAIPLGETASTMFDELKKAAPVTVWEKFRQEIVEADTMMGIQHYEDAKNEYDRLTKAMTPLHTSAVEKKTAWEELVKQHVALQTELAPVIAVTCSAVSAPASALNNVFGYQSRVMLETHDYPSACTEGTKALATMADIRKNYQAYRAMADTIKEARKAILAKIEKVKGALEGHLDADLSDFEARLAQLNPNVASPVRQKFDALFESAAKVTEFSDQTIAALDEIIKDVIAEMGKTGEKGRRIETLRGKGRETGFPAATSEVKKLIGTLGEDDPVKAKSRQVELDNLIRAATSPITPANIQAITKLKEDVAKDIQAYTDRVDSARLAAQNQEKELLKLITSLEKGKDEYKELFANLRDRVSDCRGLYDSTVLAVVLKGKQKLEALEVELNALKTDNAKGSKAPNRFEKVDEKIKEIAKTIKDSAVFKECLPTRRGVLKYRLEKEASVAARKVSPKEAIDKVLTEFAAEVTTAIADAETAKTARNQLVTDGKARKEELKALVNAPQLVKSLTAQIDAAMSPGEQGEIQAGLDMENLRKVIADAVANVDNRTRMETKANVDATRALLAAQEWEAKKDVFNKNAERKAEVVYNETPATDRDEDSYKQIGELYNQAKKLADAGSHGAALTKLEQATATAERFITVPLGNEATVRSYLGRVNGDWKRVVSDYVAGVNTMTKTIHDQNKTAPIVDLAVIDKQLMRIKKMFNPELFDYDVAVLSDPETPVPDKRTAKENALRRVREYRKIAKSDKVLAYLSSKNPFLKEFTTKNIETHLNLLELNLLRA